MEKNKCLFSARQDLGMFRFTLIISELEGDATPHAIVFDARRFA